jgi:hypothetical protein
VIVVFATDSESFFHCVIEKPRVAELAIEFIEINFTQHAAKAKFSFAMLAGIIKRLIMKLQFFCREHKPLFHFHIAQPPLADSRRQYHGNFKQRFHDF